MSRTPVRVPRRSECFWWRIFLMSLSNRLAGVRISGGRGVAGTQGKDSTKSRWRSPSYMSSIAFMGRWLAEGLRSSLLNFISSETPCRRRDSSSGETVKGRYPSKPVSEKSSVQSSLRSRRRRSGNRLPVLPLLLLPFLLPSASPPSLFSPSWLLGLEPFLSPLPALPPSLPSSEPPSPGALPPSPGSEPASSPSPEPSLFLPGSASIPEPPGEGLGLNSCSLMDVNSSPSGAMLPAASWASLLLRSSRR